MDLWESYKQDCLYNDDGPQDMSFWGKPTARKIPNGNEDTEPAPQDTAFPLWVYRSMGPLCAIASLFGILDAWWIWGLRGIPAETGFCLLAGGSMYLHGMRRTLREEQKEGLTRKQSLRKHWIASLSGVAIAVLLLVILAVSVMGSV